MPVLDQPGEAARLRVTVQPSVALEIEWVLHSALREDFRADHRALHALYDVERPDLLEAVRTMWAEEDAAVDGQPSGAFTELVLLAHHGGLLFGDDASALLDALGDLCASVPAGAKDWPLLAETDVERKIALHRLARLRRSPEVRRRYVDVVRRTWQAAAEKWEPEGRAAVAETVAARRAMLDKGAEWRDVVKSSRHFGELVDRVVGGLPLGGEVVVTPCYFAHVGLLYDLPGRVVFGIRAEEAGRAARARNEGLSRRLRALSDPTRLAIVDTLRARPLTVTELASRFAVSQPTMSNHVKLLREAGIVAEVREGVRRNLVVSADAAEAIVEELARVVGRDPAGPSPG